MCLPQRKDVSDIGFEVLKNGFFDKAAI